MPPPATRRASLLAACLLWSLTAGAAPEAAHARDEAAYAEVLEGDTLTRLAARYGTSVRALERANARRLKRSALLRIGDRLRLPKGAKAPPESAPGESPAPAKQASAEDPPAATPTPPPPTWPGDGFVGPPPRSPAPGQAASAAGPATPGTETPEPEVDTDAEAPVATSALQDPPSDPNHWRDHVLVRRGDTLMGIARREGVPLASLLAWNRLAEGALVKAGHRLVVERPGPRPEARSIGRASNGRLAFGEWLGEGTGYRLRFPRNAYGLAHMNERLRNCSRFVHTLFPGTADLLIGDLSRPGGGRFPPHESHQSGRDADAGYYLAGNIQNSTLHRVGVAGLDPAKTWMYMRCLIAPGDVVRMYVDRALQRGLVAYLERIGAESPESLARLFEVVGGASALIRHAPYHDTHLHVRFACPGGAAGAGAERPEGAVAGTTEVPSGPSSGSAPGSSGPAPDPLSPQAPGEVQGTEPCALEPGEAPFQP